MATRQPTLSELPPERMGEWSEAIQGIRIERDAWRLRAERAERALEDIKACFAEL